MARQTKLTLVLGTNGTGKTTFLKTLLSKIDRRQLIITPDFSEWTDYKIIPRKRIKNFEGKARIIFQPGDFAGLRQIGFRNAILVLDDFRLFDLTPKDKEDLRYLVGRRRQLALDIFIVAHGFTEIIPTFLLTFANQVVLFKTLDNPARVKDRFLDFSLVKQAQTRVNAHTDPHYFEILKLRD